MDQHNLHTLLLEVAEQLVEGRDALGVDDGRTVPRGSGEGKGLLLRTLGREDRLMLRRPQDRAIGSSVSSASKCFSLEACGCSSALYQRATLWKSMVSDSRSFRRCQG